MNLKERMNSISLNPDNKQKTYSTSSTQSLMRQPKESLQLDQVDLIQRQAQEIQALTRTIMTLKGELQKTKIVPKVTHGMPSGTNSTSLCLNQMRFSQIQDKITEFENTAIKALSGTTQTSTMVIDLLNKGIISEQLYEQLSSLSSDSGLKSCIRKNYRWLSKMVVIPMITDLKRHHHISTTLYAIDVYAQQGDIPQSLVPILKDWLNCL